MDNLGAGAPPPRWFETNECLPPADDDACLRLADMLQKRGSAPRSNLWVRRRVTRKADRGCWVPASRGLLAKRQMARVHPALERQANSTTT